LLSVEKPVQGIQIIRRRPFSRLLHPDDMERLRGITRGAINYNNPNISNYRDTAGTLEAKVAEHLRELARQKKQVRFLDIGAGEGNALATAENLAPGIIKAHGLALHGPHEKSKVAKENWTRAFSEATVFKKAGSQEGAFHVIQMRYVLEHAPNQVLALENALNSLAKGGKLFIMHTGRQFVLSASEEPPTEELVNAMKKQGFGFQHFPSWNLDRELEIITRKGSNRADLREFYDHCRLNRIQVRRDVA